MSSTTGSLVVFCLGFLLGSSSCGPSARSSGAPQSGSPCVEAEKNCDGNDFLVCKNGVFVKDQTCDAVCTPALGCTVCTPSTGTCNGDVSTACKPDGSGFFEETCDPANGSTCDAMQGICTGPCTVAAIGSSYVGCNYYATQSANEVSDIFDFGVALANTSGTAATVTVDGGGFTQPVVVSVPANQTVVQKLPWVAALKRCSGTGQYGCTNPNFSGGLAIGGAYRVRSNQPITAYQFSPIEYQQSGLSSYTNDASLLLPVNAWGQEHVVAAWPGAAAIPGMLTVTASANATSVTIFSKANTNSGDGAPAFAAGVAQTVMLNRGDVIELLNGGGDLTGSSVVSDKPVAVLGGHFCADVPVGVSYCDHLEEVMFPTTTLATKYLVAANSLPESTAPRAYIVRVIATVANTKVTFDPALPSGPVTLTAPGDFFEVAPGTESRLVTATAKVLVAQYMVGSSFSGGNGNGDPSMALAVPVEQYRQDYQFIAPLSYQTNYVGVTAPTGAIVMVDGQLIPASNFSAIGSSGFSVARVALQRTEANHRANSDQPFGISVFGYGAYTSYWYPGGLDLQTIPTE
jgi:hypothetical protein